MGEGSSSSNSSNSSKDLTGRVRRLEATHRTVAGGGPWVRLGPWAREEAAPGRRPSGPLESMLVAVKDLVAVASMPLGAGSVARADASPEPRDAAVVARLRQAGAVVAGTVALHELAFGVTGVNDQVGFPAHPTHPGHIPGGSSSGSAVAVALHECDLAVGTDTGGSVRIPAALCGVVGFKPSRGTYPLDSVLPLAPTLDHVGLLAWFPETVAITHRALTGDGSFQRSGNGFKVSVLPQRVGVDRAAVDAAAEPVAVAVEDALRSLRDAGCELVDLRWPDEADATAVMRVSTTILFAEAAATHRDLLDGPAFQLLGPDVQARLAKGAAIGDDELQAAHAQRERIEAAVRATLGTVDVVAGPTVPVVAPTVEQARDDPSLPQVLVANTRLANVAGVPALSLPIPLADRAPRFGLGRRRPPLPVGLQLVGATDGQVLGSGIAVAGSLRQRR